MAAVAQLKALLKIDNKQFKAGVRDSKGATKKFGQSLAGIGRMMGAAFTIGAVVSLTKRVIDFASEIRHTADNLKLNSESLQALNSVALKYGMTIEDLNKGLAKLRQSQGKVAEGDKEYTDALDLLNISAKEFAEADSDKALELIAQAYTKASGDALAFSAVTDLMGRSAKKATAFLEELADKGLARVREGAIAAGDVMRDNLTTELEHLGTQQAQIMMRVEVAWGKFVGDLLGGIIVLKTMGQEMKKEEAAAKALGERLTLVGWLRSGGMKRALIAGGEAILPFDKPRPTKPEEDYTDAIKAAESANDKLRITLLKGKTKIYAELAAKEADLNKQIADTENKALRQRLSQRVQMYQDMYIEQIKVIDRAESEKARIIKQREDEIIQAAEDRKAGITPQGIRGEGARFSHTESMGASFGGERQGLQSSNRELKLKQESNRVQREQIKVELEMMDALQEMRLLAAESEGR